LTELQENLQKLF